MRNTFKAGLFAILLATTCLVGCSNSSNKNKEFAFDEVRLIDNPIELEDTSYYYSNQIYDVDPDFTLLIGSDNTANSNLLTSINNENSPVTISDAKGNRVNCKGQLTAANGSDYFTVDPVYSYVPGETYEIELHDKSLFFKDKDPNMDTLYFNVKKEDTNNLQISNTIKYLDLLKLISYPDFNDPDAPKDPKSQEAQKYFEEHQYTFLYKEDASKILNENDLFYVATLVNGEYKVDFVSFPGKFVKSEFDKTANAYLVYMKHADLNEVYNDGTNTAFDVYQTYTPTAFTEVQNIFDKKQVVNALREDERFIAQVDAINKALGNTTTVMDVISHLAVDFTFKVDAPTVMFQVKVETFFPLSENTQIKIQFLYQYTVKFECTAGVEVERFLGIPYWISAHGDITRITDQTVSINIIFMYKWSEKEKKDAESQTMQEVILKAMWALDDDPGYFTKGGDASVCRGNTRNIPLLQFNIPFSIFNFHIGLDFALTLDFNVMFGYTYQTHEVQKIASFSTDDGVKCTANNTTIQESCHQLYFAGEAGVKAGLVVMADLEVAGLRGIFDLGITAQIGAYIDLKGTLSTSWDDNQVTSTTFVAHLEIGAYGGLTAFFDVLFFHPKYDIASAKWPFIIVGNPTGIDQLIGPDEITINSTEPVNVSQTGITDAKIFNADTMKFELQTFRLNQKITVNGLFQQEHEVTPITVTTDCPYVTIDANKNTIKVNDENVPPMFDAELVVRVNKEVAMNASNAPLLKIIKLHYECANVYTFSFTDSNGTHSFPVYEGTKVELPLIRNDKKLEQGQCRLGDISYNGDDFKNVRFTYMYMNMNEDMFGCYLDDRGQMYGQKETITITGDCHVTPQLRKM